MNLRDIETIRQLCTLSYFMGKKQDTYTEFLSKIEKIIDENLTYQIKAVDITCPKCGEPVKDEPGLCINCV